MAPVIRLRAFHHLYLFPLKLILHGVAAAQGAFMKTLQVVMFSVKAADN